MRFDPGISSLSAASATAASATVTLTLTVTVTAMAMASSQPKFFPDDPLWIDPESEDASAVASRDVPEGFDFVANSLLNAGESADVRALNVNTLDEVPDSGWFVNRIAVRELSVEDVARGPDTGGPRPGPWHVQSGKSEGITPGFSMRDSTGQLYFVKFDPPGNYEMATAAEVISTKILHAAGYHVPENYVATFRREDIVLEGARFTDAANRRRPMVEADLDRLLAKTTPSPDGSYRVMASKAAAGKPLGPFRYYDTRPDDPNDIFPHEHRRELRGLRVFAAWLNNADSRGINSLDTLVEVDGRSLVRHYLLDFGSTLGSAGISVKSRRSGNEYLMNLPEGFLQIATAGARVPDWTRVQFDEIPSVGRFESEFFQPDRWIPHYPNPAFDNARPDDLFWAARRVMAFTDEMIGAIVNEGELSDPAAFDHLTRVLIERRDKIGRAWLTVVNPLVSFRLSPDGNLSFDNAAVMAGVATEPRGIEVEWFVFDNGTRDETSLTGPAAAPRTARYLKAAIATDHPEYPHWKKPVQVFFGRTEDGWKTVGVER
jgi:hypothetical protein